MPFRQAHAAAGALVRMASARGVELGELSLADLRATAPDVDVRRVRCSPCSMPGARSIGATSSAGRRGVASLAAIEAAERELGRGVAMHHFEYRGDELYCEDVPLAKIAAEVGTPVYVYSHATLERHYKVFDSALGAASRTSSATR